MGELDSPLAVQMTRRKSEFRLFDKSFDKKYLVTKAKKISKFIPQHKYAGTPEQLIVRYEQMYPRK